MRISDWSSDVCSSDLRVSCTIFPPDSSTSTCRFASHSMVCMTKRTEFTFFVSVRVPKGSPGLRTDTLTSARMEPSSIFPSHERSEEHTSELQSLMRISYAVFCLKKKNKTDRNDIISYTSTQS